MYDAQTIQMQDTTSTVLYGPWFPRGGDYGIFTLEVAAIGGGGTPTLTVTLEEKNAEDTGDGSATPGGLKMEVASSPGRDSIDWEKDGGTSSPKFQGFKELVRYKYTLSGGASGVTTWATYRMLAPVWYDTV